MKPTDRKIKKEKIANQCSPASYQPNYPTHFNKKGAKIGRGRRDAGKLDTSKQPGPHEYRIRGGFDDLGVTPKFVMGMRYGEKSMMDMPGPGDYENYNTSFHHEKSHGPAHCIGTGN